MRRGGCALEESTVRFPETYPGRIHEGVPCATAADEGDAKTRARLRRQARHPRFGATARGGRGTRRSAGPAEEGAVRHRIADLKKLRARCLQFYRRRGHIVHGAPLGTSHLRSRSDNRRSVHICSGGFVLWTERCASKISFCWFRIDCTPFFVLTMCLVCVAMVYRRYLLINLYVRPGNNLSYRLPIDCRSAVLVGEHNFW